MSSRVVLEGFQMSQPVDCLVVGAGPVGLTFACQLRQYGVSCRIIDKLDGPVIRTKAAAIWSRTLEFLGQMDLAQTFVDSGAVCRGASIFADRECIANIPLDSIDSLYNYVLMIPQHTSEKILRERLEELGTKVEYGCSLESLVQEPQEVIVTLESGETLRSRYLVGCDGAHSGVRRALGLDFEGKKLESQWLVADIHLEGLPSNDQVLAYIHQEGPTAMFPLGGDFFRLVAQTEPLLDDTNEGRAKFETERILTTRVGPDVSVNQIDRAGYFSIHERQVGTYQVGRTFLAGDSAHVHSPIGGQGMNTGVHDANNLAWKMAMVLAGVQKAELLETYNDERHPIGKWLVQMTSLGTQMITNKQPIVAAIRKQAAKVLANLPLVQNRVRDTLSELEIHYRDSTLSDELEFLSSGWKLRKGIRAGDRVPDGLLRRGTDELQLSDLLKGCRYHLLLFVCDGEGEAQNDVLALHGQMEKMLGSWNQVLVISTRQLNWENCHCFLDESGELHQTFAVSEPSVYLVRPDLHVAHRSQPINVQLLLDYLSRWAS